jgi:hypothetical protein
MKVFIELFLMLCDQDNVPSRCGAKQLQLTSTVATLRRAHDFADDTILSADLPAISLAGGGL